MRKNGGFVKKMMMLVVAFCIMFIVVMVLAQYIGPAVSNNLGSLSNNRGNSSSGAQTYTGNNPLLSVLDVSESNGGSGGLGSSQSNIPAASRSAYAGRVALGEGSASYTAQPFEEYVTLQNNGDTSIDITGWKLQNGKGSRPVQTSGNDYVYPTPDTATIGSGTQFLDPSGVFRTGDIVLKPGDYAYVTTGGPFISYPYQISTSFRENKCEGYLGTNYPFDPPLELECPYPTDDAGIHAVTDECYNYIESLGRCEDPQKADKTNFDSQTGPCRTFMAARTNYASCVALHQSDSDFSLRQWRVFLGRKSELWASQKETITLYDSRGLIVDQISY